MLIALEVQVVADGDEAFRKVLARALTMTVSRPSCARQATSQPRIPELSDSVRAGRFCT